MYDATFRLWLIVLLLYPWVIDSWTGQDWLLYPQVRPHSAARQENRLSFLKCILLLVEQLAILHTVVSCDSFIWSMVLSRVFLHLVYGTPKSSYSLWGALCCVLDFLLSYLSPVWVWELHSDWTCIDICVNNTVDKQSYLPYCCNSFIWPMVLSRVFSLGGTIWNILILPCQYQLLLFFIMKGGQNKPCHMLIRTCQNDQPHTIECDYIHRLSTIT